MYKDLNCRLKSERILSRSQGPLLKSNNSILCDKIRCIQVGSKLLHMLVLSYKVSTNFCTKCGLLLVAKLFENMRSFFGVKHSKKPQTVCMKTAKPNDPKRRQNLKPGCNDWDLQLDSEIHFLLLVDTCLTRVQQSVFTMHFSIVHQCHPLTTASFDNARATIPDFYRGPDQQY